MAKSQQPKILTKKHLARQQREEMQTRYIVIASIAVIALVFILIAAGLLNQYVLQPNKAVAEVNGDKISVREFQVNVRYQRARIIENYQQLAMYFSDNEQFQQQLQQTLGNVEGIGQNTLDGLIDDRLIRQEAKRRGITISTADLDKGIEEAFGYYANGRPTATATIEPLPTSTLSSLQQTLTAPTATTVPTITLPTATATLAPSPTASLVLTPTATATPYTKDAFKENFDNQVKAYKDATSMSEKDFRRIVESQLYYEKVMDAVLADMNIATDEEQIWVRRIVVSEPMTATLLLDQINNGGDFALLAEQNSSDTSTSFKGGDMGWFGKGKQDAAFEQAAWSLQVGEVVSQPVQTASGYEIIQLLGKEVRPIDSSSYQQLRQTKFTEWLAAQRKQAEDALKLTIYDFWTTIVPSEPSVSSSSSTP
jgi:parvulin-like peptidyl-prolyl isomerase